MQTENLKEITVKLPTDLVNTITPGEIVSLLLDKALSKSEYYLSKCKEFEEKYHLPLADFKKKIEEDNDEVFEDWDHLLIWEGYELAYQEWKKKYEELKGCRG